MAVAVPFTLGGKVLSAITGKISGMAKGIGKELRLGERAEKGLVARSPKYAKFKANREASFRQAKQAGQEASRASSYEKAVKAGERARAKGLDPTKTNAYKDYEDQELDLSKNYANSLPASAGAARGTELDPLSKFKKSMGIDSLKNIIQSPGREDETKLAQAELGMLGRTMNGRGQVVGSVEADDGQAIGNTHTHYDNLYNRTADGYIPEEFSGQRGDWKTAELTGRSVGEYANFQSLYNDYNSGNAALQDKARKSMREHLSKDGLDDKILDSRQFNNGRLDAHIEGRYNALI
jgi:hypothetical protein